LVDTACLSASGTLVPGGMVSWLAAEVSALVPAADCATAKLAAKSRRIIVRIDGLPKQF
jgi:hypothetical protein